jgi:hypothetical protein
MLQSLRCVRLALWDERGRRLISFGEAAKFPAVEPEKNQPTWAQAELNSGGLGSIQGM